MTCVNIAGVGASTRAKYFLSKSDMARAVESSIRSLSLLRMASCCQHDYYSTYNDQWLALLLLENFHDRLRSFAFDYYAEDDSESSTEIFMDFLESGKCENLEELIIHPSISFYDPVDGTYNFWSSLHGVL